MPHVGPNSTIRKPCDAPRGSQRVLDDSEARAMPHVGHNSLDDSEARAMPRVGHNSTIRRRAR